MRQKPNVLALSPGSIRITPGFGRERPKAANSKSGSMVKNGELQTSSHLNQQVVSGPDRTTKHPSAPGNSPTRGPSDKLSNTEHDDGPEKDTGSGYEQGGPAERPLLIGPMGEPLLG